MRASLKPIGLTWGADRWMSQEGRTVVVSSSIPHDLLDVEKSPGHSNKELEYRVCIFHRAQSRPESQPVRAGKG